MVAAMVAMGGAAFGRAADARAATTPRATAPRGDAAIIRELTALHIAALPRTETGSFRPTGPVRVLATLYRHAVGQTKVAAVLLAYPVGGLPSGCTGAGYDVFVATYQPNTVILGRTETVGDWSVDADFPGYACLSPSTPFVFTPYADGAGGQNPYRVGLRAVVALPSVYAVRLIGAGGRAMATVVLPHHFYFEWGGCDGLAAVQALDAGGRVLAGRALTAQDAAACRG